MSEVSVWPAWAAPLTTQGTQSTRWPSTRSWSTALVIASMFPPWPLTSTVRPTQCERDRTSSTSTVRSVSVPMDATPGKPWCSPLAPMAMAGATYPPSSLARRLLTLVAITVSVSCGRCGPCCSVEPTGTRTTGRSGRSVQVSDANSRTTSTSDPRRRRSAECAVEALGDEQLVGVEVVDRGDPEAEQGRVDAAAQDVEDVL